MPFFANTPESLMGRSDSKNPATTCRGITSSGRPCRRPVAAANATLAPVARPLAGKRRLRVDDPRDENLYCWQHKEQASLSARSSPGPRMSNTPILEERTSLDTLADRLGLLEVSQQQPEKRRRQSEGGRAGAGHSGGRQQQHQQAPPKRTQPKPKKELQLCCFSVPLEEVAPQPARPKPRPLQPTTSAVPAGNSNAGGRKKPSGQQLLAPSGSPSRHSNHSGSSQTAKYLTLIPQTASPQTASLLMAELAKPVSQMDEPGYIYMFWLTPESAPSAPAADAARSLLAPPSDARPRGQRRPSDVLASFAAATGSAGSRRPSGGRSGDGGNKVLLKIGRATNVQRRLNEWQRQCGYNLSLIRYYPYIPSASPAAVPRKMPHSHKVERLIHLELAGLGLRVADREKCAACGREHREWFEVDATRQGVADVDDIVRRWVEWDEMQD